MVLINLALTGCLATSERRRRDPIHTVGHVQKWMKCKRPVLRNPFLDITCSTA